jgi:TolB-like protein/class 3 adenylate cyclase/Tfp pilus assembly protein PilF
MAQEQPIQVGRRLSAILVADVANYSRLMHDEEEVTHSKLSVLLTDVAQPAIAEYGGRTVKNTGDGFLAEFSSAVEAVRAAVQFQSRIKELTIGDAENKRMAFRVGINISDVIVEAHDIFGDGVNIAARLEGIAEPGGICISSSVYDQVRGKVDVEFADMGEQNLKNIARPVRAYAVVWDRLGSGAQIRGATAKSPLAPRLSIVVLPFANIGGESEQDYFVDGVTESLTTDLSRMAGSFVIARNTAFAFKSNAIDVKKIGRELNVRYVLEGSVQRSGTRLRVNVQLIDAETGNHLWAERFDKPVADLFDMQDEIVSRLANTLNAELIEAEARRAARSPNPDAMELCFQGRACINRGITPASMQQARRFFARAHALDPGYIEATVGTAQVDMATGAAFMTDVGSTHFEAAEKILIQVLSLAPNHATAHMLLGAVLMQTLRGDKGIAECEQALALDRNLADAHGFIGLGKYLTGRGEEVEAHIQEALRLSPRDTRIFIWSMFVGMSKLTTGADLEAIRWFRRSLEANRNHALTHFHFAATQALVGSMQEARSAVQEGLALDPSFTIRRYRVHKRSDDPTYLAKRERFCEGMRLAGVPRG